MTPRSRPGSGDAAAEGSAPKRLKSVSQDDEDTSQKLLEAACSHHKPYQEACKNAKQARDLEAKREEEVEKASTELYKHVGMLEKTERLKAQKMREVEKQRRLLEASEEELETIDAAIHGHKYMIQSTKQRHDTAVLLLKEARNTVKIKQEKVGEAEATAVGEAIGKLNEDED